VNQIGTHIASIAGLHLPPTVALLLTIGFVAFLFRRDFREQPNVTGALWLPFVWLLIGCSRNLSAWLAIFGVPLPGWSSYTASLEEGSPLDACFYFALIAAGVYVLSQRQIDLSQVFRKNIWLLAFLLYCFVAILWSDSPFVAFKRWIKILGHPVMALILFTEPDFREAFTRLMKRSAYVLVPASVLVIKYYPEIGRRYDEWEGLPLIVGIAQGKNLLGASCMLFGLFFFWLLLQTWRTERTRERRNELLLITGFLIMILWLFKLAHSATAEICMLVGILTVFVVGRPFVNRRMIIFYVFATVCVIIVAELSFGISAYVLEFLHRDRTITGRTALWADLLEVKINPIFGVGFESFWMGHRLEQLREGRPWQPNEAHNGYLEIYLDLGLVGLSMFFALIVATFGKIRRELLRNFEWGRFGLGFLLALLLHELTEVSFRGPHPFWFIFYVIAIEYPNFRFTSLELVSDHSSSEEEEMEVVRYPDEVRISADRADSISEFGLHRDLT
jgi:O-antigen ligase